MLWYVVLGLFFYLCGMAVVFCEYHKLPPRWYLNSKKHCLQWSAAWPITLLLYLCCD